MNKRKTTNDGMFKITYQEISVDKQTGVISIDINKLFSLLKKIQEEHYELQNIRQENEEITMNYYNTSKYKMISIYIK